MSANPNLPPASRAERAEQAARLKAQGLNGVQIAKAMGVSRAYAYALLNDPAGDADRERKDRYRGRCGECGAATDGSNGRVGAPERCWDCATAPVWTRETVIAALRRWADVHGIPPTSLDWGNWTSHRHPDFVTGEHPHADTVKRVFGTFNEGVRAAGFKPLHERDAQRYDPATLASIVARIQAGESPEAISREMGLCDAAVGTALRYRGLTVSRIRAAA